MRMRDIRISDNNKAGLVPVVNVMSKAFAENGEEEVTQRCGQVESPQQQQKPPGITHSACRTLAPNQFIAELELCR
jgi:hypothetical protein